MKKTLYIVIIILSLSINILLTFYIIKGNTNSTVGSKQQESDNNYANYYFMNNPVDTYFMNKFNDSTLSQMDIKDYQDIYQQVWGNIYKEIMTIIEKKCIYEEDLQRFNNFVTEVDTSFNYISPILLAEMLDNYEMEESPEKHSYGTGTNYKLHMYQGMIYRNACMLFIPYLTDEYQLSNSSELDKIIESTLQ